MSARSTRTIEAQLLLPLSDVFDEVDTQGFIAIRSTRRLVVAHLCVRHH